MLLLRIQGYSWPCYVEVAIADCKPQQMLQKAQLSVNLSICKRIEKGRAVASKLEWFSMYRTLQHLATFLCFTAVPYLMNGLPLYT
jgi:hypothetical protein